MATRLAVDVGGTFSDLVLYDEDSGGVLTAKGLSTPAAHEHGVLEIIADAVSSDQLIRTQFFLHGTTVGLNALLERRGPVIALLTTDGFRDVLEIRRGDRLAAYDPVWRPEDPLVKRALRLPIKERVLADGTVARPLHTEDVVKAAETLADASVESVAIAFINSYANPEHELQARDLLLEAGFTGDVSMSHELSREFREYERTSTAVIDAFVRPRVVHYLSNLKEGLTSGGFSGTALVTRCGGGSLTFLEAERRPFETVMSGPVAGVVGAAELCRNLGLPMAIAADVGGTSFDTCLILDGQPHLKHEGEIAGLPVQTTWVDVHSIGAGGGSIIYVDSGLLRVGPQSAGAKPGPACYAGGGLLPTVTDAAVFLGMIPASELAGGIVLDVGAAEQALELVAVELSLTPLEAASGALRIIASTMADAIRSVSLTQGHDPRQATLIMYGGAGPLFGTLLGSELDISQIVVPNYPGNFSAWGLLRQDLAQSAATTTLLPLDAKGLATAGVILGDLIASLRARSDPQLESLELLREASLDLRYVGQEYSLNISVEATNSGKIRHGAAHVAKQFASSYRRTFGHTLSEPVEIVTTRAMVRRVLPGMKPLRASLDGGSSPSTDTRAFSFAEGDTISFAARDRATISLRERLQGPLILTEATATTYIDSGWELSLLADGSLLIERLDKDASRD